MKANETETINEKVILEQAYILLPVIIKSVKIED